MLPLTTRDALELHAARASYQAKIWLRATKNMLMLHLRIKHVPGSRAKIASILSGPDYLPTQKVVWNPSQVAANPSVRQPDALASGMTFHAHVFVCDGIIHLPSSS